MRKRCAALCAVILVMCLALSGCVGMGAQQPQKTVPPIKPYAGVAELQQAVAAAKANASAADEQDLKSLSYYYALSTPPEGAKISEVRASSQTLAVGYTFGPVKDGSFDNHIDLTWFRGQKASEFLQQLASNLSQSGMKYDTLSANGVDYLIVVPEVNLSTATPPADTAAPTPTPQIGTYCQLVCWGENDASFQCAVPLGFTKDDIAKYCHALQVALN